MDRQPLNAQQKEIYADFIGKMLELSPSKRMNANNALEHDIFQLKDGSVEESRKAKVVLEGLLHYRVIV